jgi:DNA-directed RNA polymerase specialized sigma24 family protein
MNIKQEEDQIVSECQAGCQNSWKVFVDKHQQALLEFIKVRLPPGYEAEDVAQDSWLWAYKKINKYPVEKFINKVFQHAKGLCIEKWRLFQTDKIKYSIEDRKQWIHELLDLRTIDPLRRMIIQEAIDQYIAKYGPIDLE